MLSVNHSRATSPIDKEEVVEPVLGGGAGKGVGTFMKEMIDKEIPLDGSSKPAPKNITRDEVKRRMGISIPSMSSSKESADSPDIFKDGSHKMDAPSSDEERRREQKEFFFQRYDPNKNMVKGGVSSTTTDREKKSISRQTYGHLGGHDDAKYKEYTIGPKDIPHNLRKGKDLTQGSGSASASVQSGNVGSTGYAPSSSSTAPPPGEGGPDKVAVKMVKKASLNTTIPVVKGVYDDYDDTTQRKKDMRKKGKNKK